MIEFNSFLRSLSSSHVHTINTDSSLRSQVKSLPILVYTEKVAPDDLKSYMEAGMDGCLSRPFDQDALLTTLRQAVPKHMKPREDAQRQDKVRCLG